MLFYVSRNIYLRHDNADFLTDASLSDIIEATTGNGFLRFTCTIARALQDPRKLIDGALTCFRNLRLEAVIQKKLVEATVRINFRESLHDLLNSYPHGFSGRPQAEKRMRRETSEKKKIGTNFVDHCRIKTIASGSEI